MRQIISTDGSIENLSGYYKKRGGINDIVGSGNYKKSINIFDSAGGISNGHGYTFRFSHSLDKIVGYRVVNFMVDGLPMPFTTPTFLSLHGNLARGSYTGHRNGKAENIISCIINPGTGARFKWDYIPGEQIPIELDTLQDVYLEMRDPNGLPQPSLNFIVVIEFTHQF
jgi:hypothetical protein